MGFFDALFGNPGDEASKYFDQIPGHIKPYLDPYFQAGNQALPGLQQQYGQLMNDPGGMLNKIGAGYQKSPGFDFAMKQALQGSGHAAAAGGMAGTPEHEQQNMQLASDIGNQDYNNWLHNAMGMYGQGLQGQQGMAGMGMEAGGNLANYISQALAQKGKLKAEGAANRQNMWGNVIGSGLAAFGNV